jgi:RNA polymerase sigma-70 factor (ECF subfamily)
MAEIEERTLLYQAQHGQVDAFGEIVRRYQTSVFGVCMRLLGDRSEAEDAAQEVFLRAYERLHTFDTDRPFGPWIRKVAANFCFNRLQASFPVVVEWNEETIHTTTIPAPASISGAVLSEDPLQLIMRQEAADRVRAALWSLPPHFRIVIELRHFQGLDYEAIATEVGLSLNNVKTHLFRARRLLAERIRKKEDESISS